MEKTAVQSHFEEIVSNVAPSNRRKSTSTLPEKEEAITVSDTERAESAVACDNAVVPQNTTRAPDWRRKFIRFGPLSGIFAMCLSIASIFAALGVLVGSDGTPVANWKAPPSTFLAILTAIANLSVRFAAIQGAVIAWWYRASRRQGTTLESLHYNWRSGSSLHGALTAGRRMGLLGLACIFSTIVVIDGPLLQRASTVHAAPWVNAKIPLNISIAQELPTYFGDSYAAPGSAFDITTRWSYAFNDTIPNGNGGLIPNDIYPIITQDPMIPELSQLMKQNEPLAGVVKGCSETCEVSIRAPALAPVACNSRMIPINYTDLEYIKNNRVVDGKAGPLYSDQFFISIALDLEGPNDALNLVTAYPEYTTDTEELKYGNCSGHLNVTACSFQSAVGEYHASVSANKATLLNAGQPVIVALANNSAVNRTTYDSGQQRSTLAPIAELAWERFECYAALFRTSNGQLAMNNIGQGLSVVREFQLPVSSACYSFSDPMPYVREALNDIMVWAGVVAASQNATELAYLESKMDPDLPVQRTVTGYRTGSHAVFHTDYAYFIVAALVEFLCLACIVPTYWGWWKLERDVSFSPLEIAKAFRSPVLAGYDSNSRGRHMAHAGRESRLSYVVGESDPGSGRNGFVFTSTGTVSNT